MVSAESTIMVSRHADVGVIMMRRNADDGVTKTRRHAGDGVMITSHILPMPGVAADAGQAPAHAAMAYTRNRFAGNRFT
ncbi:MAG: hypothetical protein H6Q31_1919 [Bacteroidetes bacterium]|nr:hypothetical protein [Bacteroidota bacterium]